MLAILPECFLNLVNFEELFAEFCLNEQVLDYKSHIEETCARRYLEKLERRLNAGSNAYLLAKIGVDTAENEPCKVCPLSVYRSPRFESFSALIDETMEERRASSEEIMGLTGTAAAAG